jgi:hypothetical protein
VVFFWAGLAVLCFIGAWHERPRSWREPNRLFVFAVLGATVFASFFALAGIDNARMERRDCRPYVDPEGMI